MKTTRDPALELPNAPASDLNRKPKSRVLVWLKRIGMGLVFNEQTSLGCYPTRRDPTVRIDDYRPWDLF